MKSSLWEIILSLEVGNFISPFLGNLHLPFTPRAAMGSGYYP